MPAVPAVLMRAGSQQQSCGPIRCRRARRKPEPPSCLASLSFAIPADPGERSPRPRTFSGVPKVKPGNIGDEGRREQVVM